VLMRRLALGCAFLCALLIVAAGAGSNRPAGAPAAPVAGSQGLTCSEARKAVTAYKRLMPRLRRTYFKRHRNTTARKAFVKRQNSKLRTLQVRSTKTCRAPAPQPQPQPPTPQPPPSPQPQSPGQSEIFAANCKYGLAPYPGYLRVSTRPPRVTGAPGRPGAEWVRFAAWLVDPAGNTVLVTSWSGWLAAADGAWATWTGETSFTADWRGSYRIDFRIEWWDQSSLIAWQVRRITNYYYFDEWNTAWGGPFPSCMRQPV
jgi:hypothetical protein